jgi:phosphoglycerate dehydrogenase-like enzyme
MRRGLLLLGRDHADTIYGPRERAQIAQHVDLVDLTIVSPATGVEHPMLKEVEVIFSSGEMPSLEKEFLDRAPRLRAVFHAGEFRLKRAAGEFWGRNVRVSSSDALHRYAVADYAVGAILFGLKHGFLHAVHARKHGRHSVKQPVPGTFESTVGLSSLGATGRILLRRLRAFDLNVIVHDPTILPDEARALDITLVSMEELFRQADAISFHTPDHPGVPGTIRGIHFASMKRGAVFINTARGALVREQEMIGELVARSDLTAVLDVTGAGTSAPDSPLHTMPNVILTPGIVTGRDEGQRWMGQCMIDEYFRWTRGEPLLWEITRGNVVPRH